MPSKKNIMLAALSLAAGVLPAFAQAPIPYQLEADDIQYDLNTGRATAAGAVEVTDGEQTVRADTLTYHAESDTLTASGNVVYLTGNGEALLVDELTLTGQMKHATLRELRLRVPELGEVLTAREAGKDDNTITLKDATYSPCQTCLEGTDRKIWQIRADKITYDTETYRAKYQNAVMDVYDVPILYVPYFSHPIGATTPQSGFLFPRFGTSTNTGEEVTLAYYHYLPNTNTDYTLRTRAMSSRGVMGLLERRQHFGAWNTDLRTSFIEDDRRDTFRGHARFAGEYTLQPGRRFGLNGEISSDDVYLNDFFSRNDSYLPSTLYLEDAGHTNKGGHYFGLNATYFQDLEPTRDPANTAQILPHLQWQRYWGLGTNGTQLTTTFDTLALHRSTGAKVRRVLGEVNLTSPVLLSDEFLGGGHLLTFGAEMRTDFYHVEDAPGDSQTLRGLPQISAKWERPLLNPRTNHTITPIVMAVLAPRGGNSDDDIPNEDSVAYELDMNNLFATNRYAGYDRVESGPRIIYGLDNRWGAAGAETWRLFLGQSWRRFDDDNLPAAGGTATNVSDWVGYVSGQPMPWLNFSSLFRLDNADWNARRLDNFVRMGDEDASFFRLTHTLLDQGPEELQLKAGWQINNQLRLTGETRRDIEDGGRQLYGEIALEYIYDCVEFTLLTRRRGFTNVDVQPSTDYLLNINLLTFGQHD